MKTSGYFPTVFTENNVGEAFWCHRRSDGARVGFFYPNSPGSDYGNMAQKVRDLYMNSLNIAPWTTAKEFNGLMYGGYAVVEEGKPHPTPAPFVLHGTDITVNNSPYWQNAKRDALIIVSDFERLRMMLSFKNGGTTVTRGTRVHNVRFDSVCSVMGLPIVKDPKGYDCFDIGGEYLLHAYGSSCKLTYEGQEKTDDINAYEDGFDHSPLQAMLDDPRSFYSETLYPEVTSVTAEANTSTLDLLTSLAEMPETVKSIYDGLKFMLKGLRDVKKGRLRWGNKATKVKRIHEQKVYQIDHEFAHEYLQARNERTRRILAAKKAQKLKQLENDLKRNLDDIALELSSLWLNYRYNISPTVYMIEDMIDTYFQKDELFMRWSSRVIYEQAPPEIEGFTKSGQFDIVQRVFIKRCFLSGTAYGQSLSASIFTTAWELIPLSFVYDWIINIGEFIATSASSTLSKVSKQGSTYSLKCGGAVTYTGAHDTVVTVEFRGYKRVKINPNDYCRLFINPDISGKRQIDALALAWQMFVKRIWNK